MFPPTDNPARRLLEVLNLARAKQDMPILQLWAQIFEFPPEDIASCYRALGHLNGLLDSVEARIRQLPELDHDLYLRDIPTLRGIICVPHLKQNWHAVKNPLDHGVLTGLEFCASELSKQHKEDAVPREELDKIRKEFTGIFRSVSKAAISPELKLILFDLLTAAILAIEQYKILGNDGLKKAVAYALGVLTLHENEFLPAKKEGIISQTFAAIKGLATLITVAYRLKQLGGFPDILHLPDNDGK